MTTDLSDSAKRVQDFLAGFNGSFVVKELASSTRTAKDAAESIGCTVAQIAKSLVFKDKSAGIPVLVIASGTNRVSPAKIQDTTSLELKRADGNYVKKMTGFAIGGIPPAGHKEPLRTLLDQDLQQYQEIWAAAGTPHAVFRLTPGDLQAITKGDWLDLREEE